MKKPSKKWKEFCQIINIVNIGIGKQQRKLTKLNKKKELLLSYIDEHLENIDCENEKLKNLNVVVNEKDAVIIFFKRRENLRSLIESIVFDLSLINSELDELNINLDKVEKEKLRLEKRKDILEELKKEILQ